MKQDILLKNAVQLILNKDLYEIVRRIEKYLEYNVQYEADSKFEGFDHARFKYDYMKNCTSKLKNSIYQKASSAANENIRKGKGSIQDL